MVDRKAPIRDQARHQWIAAHILPHVPEVRAWLRRHARSLRPCDVDDLMQEAFARLWESDYLHISSGRKYLFTVLRNLFLEGARHSRIVPMERMAEVEALRIASDEPGPERRVAARQELQRIEQVISTLPHQCRRAFELHRFQNLTYQQVADEMGITKKTVEKHLTNALSRLMETYKLHTEQPIAAPDYGIPRHDPEQSKD